MKRITVALCLLLTQNFVNAQNLLDTKMQGSRGIVDSELERIAIIDDFGLNEIETLTVKESSYDYMQIDSLALVRDKFETTLMTLKFMDASKYEASYLEIKNLKEAFDEAINCISVMRGIENGVIDDNLTLEFIEQTSRKVDSLKNEQEEVLSEIIKIINPDEQNDEELTTIPEIDGLQNNLTPSVKFVATSPQHKLGQIRGALFTGNNLNDEFNPEAFYNEGSSTYGFMTYGHIRLFNHFAVNGNISLVEKSIKTPTEENAINMHYLTTKLGFEVAANEYVAAFGGFNLGRPIDNLTVAKANIKFKDDEMDMGVTQHYFNIGAIIQANLQPGTQDSRLTIEVNNIFLNENLKETLNRPDDSGLLIIKLSLTKKL